MQMTVRYKYTAPDRVMCRVQYMTTHFFTRHCAICQRPVKPEYIVDMPFGCIKYLPQQFKFKPMDEATIAQILFAEHAPIHGRCLPVWATMLSRLGTNDHETGNSFLPVLREWDIHSRCYTIPRLRWYKRLMEAVSRQNIKKLVHWPLPTVDTVPTPRQAMGMILHNQARRFHEDVRGNISIALRGYDRPGEICLKPVHRCSAETIAQALQYFNFTDRGIFQIIGGLPVFL